MFRLISFLLIIFYANHTYAQSYFKGNNLYEGNTAVTSAGGTTTLTIASQTVQILTGSASQNFNLPNATLMPEGRRFEFKNASTGSLVIRDTGANTLFTLLSGQSAVVWLQDNATANGTWYVEFSAVDLTSTAQVIGTLPIASGGTGQTTAPNAINALLPDQTGNAGEFLTTNGSVASWAPNPLGTVTSVGLTVPASSIFGVTGSPVTTSGDLGLTVTGTSGGIPYFDTTSTLSSSALLTDHGIVVGSGAGAAPNTIATGSAGQVLQSAGSGSDPAWTTATYPGTSGTSGTILRSDGTNIVNSSVTYPNSATANKVLVGDGTNIVLSTPTFSQTATSGSYMRGDGTNWITSTLVLPNDVTAGSIVFGSATNTYGQDNANLFWDDSNNILLLGHNSSVGALTAKLQVIEDNNNNIEAVTYNSTAGTGPIIALSRSKSGTIGTNTVVANGDTLGEVVFYGADGTGFVPGARISSFVNGTPGTNDMPGNLVFSTTADGASSSTARLTIASTGQMFHNRSSSLDSSMYALDFPSSSRIGFGLNDTSAGNGAVFLRFYSNSSSLGTITNNNNTAVAYNTTSDYRLKKNILPMDSELEKIKKLKPAKFKWKKNNVDDEGFLAHEVQEIFPRCVTGTKDDPNNVQMIDKSCLVPYLAKAIQELSEQNEILKKRIDDLEARLKALEGK